MRKTEPVGGCCSTYLNNILEVYNVLMPYLLQDRNFALQTLLQLLVQPISGDFLDSDHLSGLFVHGLPYDSE